MYYLRQVIRLLTIYRIVVRYGLDELLLSTDKLRPLRLLLYITPGYWLCRRNLTRGMQIRLALEELGPIFVKFGQILSTRRDLLPDDISIELAKLQDNVTPFSSEEACAVVEAAYGRPVKDVFAEFDPVPIAAASIAQVHVARLYNGREVVVKVVRPGIQPRIRQDIELLHLLARLAVRYWEDGRRLRPVEVVTEFEKTLYDELDLMKEAANCALLKRNFQESNLIYIPEVEWDYTQPNVMVMERVSGIPSNDIEALRRLGVNLKYLAETGVEIFFTQVFRDNFFHADMHPGNIFINARDLQHPHYIALDFGIMGTLSTSDQHYLAENLLAFFNRDYRRVAELHVNSEWVPSGTRVEEFEGAIRSVCEPFFNRPLKEISFGLVLLRLFQTARRFHMEVQPQLVLLQKTLLNIEGMGRQIYPDLDLWKTAKPYLERWMSERIGIRGFFKGIRTNLPFLAENLPELPLLMHEFFKEQRVERAEFKKLNRELIKIRQDLESQQQRNTLTFIGSTLLLSASIILSATGMWALFNLPLLGMVLGVVGSVFLLLAWEKK